MQVFAGTSVAKVIAERLARRIVVGELAPGTPLKQDHVAAEFETSHVPVREAFRLLEVQGLVVASPRRGVRVAPLEPEAVQEVTVMRAALEPLAVRHADRALLPAAVAEARTALEAAETADSLAARTQANLDFHTAIITPCQMPRLLQIIAGLNCNGARFVFATSGRMQWDDRSEVEHAAILERLEAGDLEGAASRLGAHILAAGEALRTALGR